MTAAVPVTARIGPNAVWRLLAALRADGGEPLAAAVLCTAGLSPWLAAPPQTMVDEHEVARLYAALRATVPEAQARRLARAAGTATGDYLLARRIPRAAQWLLRALPATLASRVLLAAVARHAWTFAGSGRFASRPGRPVRFSITGNPLCHGVARADGPQCDFHAAAVERLWRALVHPQARVVEVACEARGDPACRFEIRWP